jgi:hypothetical protein
MVKVIREDSTREEIGVTAMKQTLMSLVDEQHGSSYIL